jgi:poly(A) polymerase
MTLLEIKPGPVVGRAYNFLLELRMEHGPLGADRAAEELRIWWAQQPESHAESAEEPNAADTVEN